MAELDLDARRAARAEANGEARDIKLGGERFKLPPELTYEAALKAAEGDLFGMLELILGPKDFERFKALQPTVADMTDVWEFVQTEYGKTQGESSASTTS